MASVPTRTLFTQLVDDAAVFPPGNFSLTEAIDRRCARRGTPASDVAADIGAAIRGLPALDLI
ncbi:hypothetical protein [Flexivirga sp.]|uniref:hypothetical protein n=1 Tax=Flexivirga sp. TaxID=1962927 RepID=UPI003F80327A